MNFPKRKSSIIMITPYARYRSFDSKNILTHQRNRKASDASCFFMCCRLLLCSCAIVHVRDYQACAKVEVSKLNFMCLKGRLQMKNSCRTSTFVQSGTSSSRLLHLHRLTSSFVAPGTGFPMAVRIVILYRSLHLSKSTRIAGHPNIIGDHPKIPSLRENASPPLTL
jgi:hypothetical protein